MADGARLTVIVPVYNVEAYLGACLDSLLAQTRPIDEILVVDDSTDGSSALLARYADRHSSIRVTRGPGRDVNAARNQGLELARGEWIGFVDADDLADPDMYERLMRLALQHGLDMALCNARYYYEGRKPDQPIYVEADPPVGPMSGAQWLTQKLEGRNFLHAVWMHLYRRSFVEKHAMRFLDGVLHEDVTWTTRALVLAQRVAYDPKPLYAYRSAEPGGTVAAATAVDDAAIATRTMAYVRRNAARLDPAVLDRRVLRVIEGAKTNARFLSELADQASDERLSRAIRWQLVDGGLALFHKVRQLSSSGLRREAWRTTLRDGTFGLLWRNASGFRQRRKIATRYVRALSMLALPER